MIVEAEHMCMTMRGVKKPGSKTVTSAVRGIFLNDASARQEVLSLIKNISARINQTIKWTGIAQSLSI